MTRSEGASPPVRRLADWPADRLRGLAEEHGTPLYVMDLDRVRENAARLTGAFPDAEVYYAAKANTARAVLGTVHGAGVGIECVSAGELHRARAAGVPPNDLLYVAVNPPDADLDYAVDVDGLTVTVGARDTVDRLADRGFDGRLCIRVNPGVGAGHHEHVRTGADPKFGVPSEDVEGLAARVRSAFDLVGLHAHAGSGISNDDLDAHRELVSRMGRLARTVGGLEFVDVGGGFGVPYRPDDEPLDLEALAAATRAAIGDVDARLRIEPGRYLVADAGVLLTRVNTVKDAPAATIVGVDAGMNTLLRPALYGAYHPVRSLEPDADARAETTVTVAGPICESADVLAADRPLPAPERGDVLAVGNAGAYGFEMASQYNSRPRPAIIALTDGTATVARTRETIEDIHERER